MSDKFDVKSLKVDGEPVPCERMAFARDYGEGLSLHYRRETGISRRFWHGAFMPDFDELLRLEKYPQADSKEVEVEAVLVPEKSNGAAPPEVPVSGRATREVVGVEFALRRGSPIYAYHALQFKGATGAAA